MKIIITEDQYNKLQNPNRTWLIRRFHIIKDDFNDSIDEIDPCSFETFDDYEFMLFNYLMDKFYPYFYDIENFDYGGIMDELKDMFYVDTTETYYSGIEKCL
jgi:hypothetical protein